MAFPTTEKDEALSASKCIWLVVRVTGNSYIPRRVNYICFKFKSLYVLSYWLTNEE